MVAGGVGVAGRSARIQQLEHPQLSLHAPNDRDACRDLQLYGHDSGRPCSRVWRCLAAARDRDRRRSVGVVRDLGAAMSARYHARIADDRLDRMSQTNQS